MAEKYKYKNCLHKKNEQTNIFFYIELIIVTNEYIFHKLYDILFI